MKKFKLMGITLLASSVALSGCFLLPKKKTSSSSEPTTSTSEPEPAGSWTDAQKAVMTEHLNGVEIPFMAGTWEWEYIDDYDVVWGGSNDSSVSKAKEVFAADSHWADAGTDNDGDQIYSNTLSDGTVYATVYNGTAYNDDGYKVEIQAYFEEKQERTDDTDWSAKDKETMVYILDEALPFFKFGANYTVFAYTEFVLYVVDGFNQDLSEDYCKVLRDTKQFVETQDEYGYPVFTKTHTDGSKIVVEPYYDDFFGMGNVIMATYEPVVHEATAWPSSALTTIEAAAGKAIPSFAATKYEYYERHGIVYINGTTTTDLEATYEAALLSGIYEVYGGYASDWYEKVELEYGVKGTPNTDGTWKEITGFGITVSPIAKPTSEFFDGWPTAAIEEYLEEFEFDVDVPGFATNPTAQKIKTYVYDWEDVYEYYVEYYTEENEYLEEDEQYTEAQIKAMAAEAADDQAGLYVNLFDPTGAQLTAYEAKFDTTEWTKKVVEPTDDEGNPTGEVYDYWTHEETGLVMCTYNNGSATVAQIQQPGSSPIVGKSDVLTMTTFVETSSTNYAEHSYTSTETGVKYDTLCASGNNSIQIRSKNGNSGIVANGGTLSCKAITIVFEEHTQAGRSVDVYVSNSPMKITDMYDGTATKIGSIAFGEGPQTLTLTAEYSYIGVRSASDAVYMASIEFVWG